MSVDTPKSSWTSKWGTVAQLISAASSVVFGLSAAVISFNTWNLQATVANDAALGRDNENLNRLTSFLIQDGDRIDTSNRCLSVLTWYVDQRQITKIRLSEDRDSLYKDYSMPIADAEMENKRKICLMAGQSKFLSNFFFILNIHESALANYSDSISVSRKKIYYKQLRVLTCTNYTNVRQLFEKYDPKLGGIFARGFPNLSSFVGQCEANAKIAAKK